MPRFEKAKAKPLRREEVWHVLRGLRHEPPGRADTGDRRRVFCAALEQSEQLFRTAAGAGYASRPIVLFYGLSQAGRAVAAASTMLDNDSYRLSGHGIAAKHLNQRSLHRLGLVDKGLGSFTQLAPLLRSGTLPRAVPLGQVWAVLPDLYDVPLDAEGIEYKPALTCRRKPAPLIYRRQPEVRRRLPLEGSVFTHGSDIPYRLYAGTVAGKTSETCVKTRSSALAAAGLPGMTRHIRRTLL